jgi:hypothetical protein
VYACYRFTAKLLAQGDKLAACIAGVLNGLRVEHPDMGRNVCIDGSDLPAYANGHGSFPRVGANDLMMSSPILTLRGVTAPPFRPARAAATTAIRSTPPYARVPGFRSRGASRQARPTSTTPRSR